MTVRVSDFGSLRPIHFFGELRMLYRSIKWQLASACALVLLTSCCEFRERSLRKALQPYGQAMRDQFAATGKCPSTIDGLGVTSGTGLRQNGNELRGFGGTAHYVYNSDGTCELSYSGFSFCGLCRSQRSSTEWQCHH